MIPEQTDYTLLLHHPQTGIIKFLCKGSKQPPTPLIPIAASGERVLAIEPKAETSAQPTTPRTYGYNGLTFARTEQILLTRLIGFRTNVYAYFLASVHARRLNIRFRAMASMSSANATFHSPSPRQSPRLPGVTELLMIIKVQLPTTDTNRWPFITEHNSLPSTAPRRADDCAPKWHPGSPATTTTTKTTKLSNQFHF